MTTFDRYLVRCFFKFFLICLASLTGLHVIMDLFDNIDDFMIRSNGMGTLRVLRKIGKYYTLQSFFIFDKLAAYLCLNSILLVLFQIQRRNELKILIAAGVPTYRISFPLLVSAIAITGIHLVNQEFILPEFAYEKYEARGEEHATGHPVQPQYDHSTRILIDGSRVFPRLRMVRHSRFCLPSRFVHGELTTINAGRAHYCQSTPQRPAGWSLQNCAPRYDQLSLTRIGRQYVRPQTDPGRVFIVSELSHDMLFCRDVTASNVSSRELLRRIKSPAFFSSSRQAFALKVHRRICDPLLNLITAFLVIPLMVKFESRGLTSNLVACWAAIAAIRLASHGFVELGEHGWLPFDLAIWIPIILLGSVAAWCSTMVQT